MLSKTNRFEEAGAGGQLAPLRDLVQRAVLVLADPDVPLLEVLEPGEHGAGFGIRTRRGAVDEQADRASMRSISEGRPTRRSRRLRRPAGVAAEQQRPAALQHGVEGQPVGMGEMLQPPGVLLVESHAELGLVVDADGVVLVDAGYRSTLRVVACSTSWRVSRQ